MRWLQKGLDRPGKAGLFEQKRRQCDRALELLFDSYCGTEETVFFCVSKEFSRRRVSAGLLSLLTSLQCGEVSLD
jgi:hypothetical protein